MVALAPTDYRYGRTITLKNINFLSLQGSYDSDEVSFWGMRPYRRLQFTDSINRFKAGVYIHHANHGQFNSTWGNADFGAPAKWLLNLKPLLDEEEQQATAKVFISAFAEAVLKDNTKYLPIFKDVSVAKQWLPIEHYLTSFEPSTTQILADFEGDLDVTSAGDSTQLQARDFNLWKEEPIMTRDKKSQDNNALVLGWDYESGATMEPKATYALSISNNQRDWFNDSTATLQLAIAAGNHSWLAKKDAEKDEDEEEQKVRDVPNLDFTVQLVDANGTNSSIKVSAIKAIPKPLKSRFTKFEFLEEDMVGADWEVQFQTYHFPLAQFKKQNPEFKLSEIVSLQFIFDHNPYGVVLIDDIGVSK